MIFMKKIILLLMCIFALQFVSAGDVQDNLSLMWTSANLYPSNTEKFDFNVSVIVWNNDWQNAYNSIPIEISSTQDFNVINSFDSTTTKQKTLNIPALDLQIIWWTIEPLEQNQAFTITLGNVGDELEISRDVNSSIKITLISPQESDQNKDVIFNYTTYNTQEIDFCNLIIDNVVVDTDVSASGTFNHSFDSSAVYSWDVNCIDLGGMQFSSLNGAIDINVIHPFASGQGTLANPFIIMDYEQLNNVRNYLDANYLLGTDLDLVGIGFEPIENTEYRQGTCAIDGSGQYGCSVSSYHSSDEETCNANCFVTDARVGFKGSFEGNGRILSNLTINKLDNTRAGLFGFIEAGGNVSNLFLSNSTIVGTNDVGILTGMNSGVISNVHVTGSVSAPRPKGYSVGGLVGYNASNGIIENSSADVEVYGYTRVGGLVGYNLGTIQKSFALGNVEANDDAGGLVGNAELGLIENSYARGNVIAGSEAAGFVGHGGATITHSYSTGNTTGYANIGGFIGYISNMHSSPGAITNCYWDTNTSGLINSVAGEAKTTEEMFQQTTFVDWDFDTIWNSHLGAYPDFE